MAFDPKTVRPNDWGVLGGAAAIFIVSLIPSYISYDYSGQFPGFDASGGISAWHSYATLGLLLLFAAGAIVALRVFEVTTLPEIGVGWAMITTALAGLGAILVILRALTVSSAFGVSVGPGWSGYLLMLLAIATTVFAALNFRESGESTPWADRGASGANARGTNAPGANAPRTNAPRTNAPGTSASPQSAPPPTSQPPTAPPPA
jgi:hypothetical protein